MSNAEKTAIPISERSELPEASNPPVHVRGVDARISLPTYNEKQLLEKERGVFKLYGIDLEVPRGLLCAIVGPVGAGKSSLV